jgi:ADP-ribose pyrophosphatase
MSVTADTVKTMRILDARKLTDLKWLNLFDVRVADEGGQMRRWQLATRQPEPKCLSGKFSRPDAVVIAARHVQDGRIVLTREYRVPLADYEIGFPAGLVDPGEGVEEAARRELLEETGLAVVRFVKISPILYSSAGMTDESVTMVYLECDGDPSTTGNRGMERIEVILADREEVARFCADKTLKFDAKAWLVLSAFADHGRL